jgi:hypothetical protein
VSGHGARQVSTLAWWLLRTWHGVERGDELLGRGLARFGGISGSLTPELVRVEEALDPYAIVVIKSAEASGRKVVEELSSSTHFVWSELLAGEEQSQHLALRRFPKKGHPCLEVSRDIAARQGLVERAAVISALSDERRSTADRPCPTGRPLLLR